MENQDTITSIINLPDEIITLILANNEPRDIIHFGATCKQFLELVTNNDYLWKKKYSETVPNAVVKLVSERNNGNWLKEVIHFYKHKQTVCMELLTMPPEYHWRVKEVSLTDVEVFFTISTENSLNYYYTIYILQEIVNKGNNIIGSKQCLKPLYTLTTIYYAKIVLRYLLHTYLAMKWLQKHIRIELTPVFVTTFFLQWIDVTKIYSDEDVEQKIQLLVTRVQQILKGEDSKLKPIQQFERKNYTEKQVLHAITKVIYDNNTRVSRSPSSKTLNIVKVIDENDGTVVTYGAIYHAVAKRFGLKCEIIAFPNHFFLEFESSDEPNQIYAIDLFNGEIKPKRRCPFSHGPPSNYEYCPDSLLQFIYSSYMRSKGPIKNWLQDYDRNCNFKSPITDDIPHDELKFTVDWPEEKLYSSVDSKTVTPDLDIVCINTYFLETYKDNAGLTEYAAVHRKGYNMMLNKYILTLVTTASNDHLFFRGHVHSENSKSLTYFVNIAFEMSGGCIVQSMCECVAGKGPKAVCKHVACVSYAILRFIEHHEWPIRKTPTESKQTWHEPKKVKFNSSPKKAEHLTFEIQEYNVVTKRKRSNMCFDPRPETRCSVEEWNNSVRSKVINYCSLKGKRLGMNGVLQVACWSSLINDHDYLKEPLHFQYILNRIILEDVHLEMILVLSRLNKSSEPVNRRIVIKRRHKAIKYAVGMICYHNIYNYICVIRGWEVDGNRLTIQGVDDLRGKDQPFYCVMAGDQSERFVAQENLKVVYAPFRIQNLEDCLAREFTHFDGFSYVPNDEKLLEYPDEEQYIEAFKKSAINLG